MKQCPQCRQVYLDDTLNFCLSDGASLLSNSSEEETVMLPSKVVKTSSESARQGVNPVFAYLTIGLLALIAGGAIVLWTKSDSNNPINSLSGNQPQNTENKGNNRQELADSRNQNLTAEQSKVNKDNAKKDNTPPQTIDPHKFHLPAEHGLLFSGRIKNMNPTKQISDCSTFKG